MRRFRVILRPSTGASTFVRPGTGNLVDAYREITVEAATEQEAREVALTRSAGMSGQAMAAIRPAAVLPVWVSVLNDRSIPERSKRAVFHTLVGEALHAGGLDPADLVPDVGDPRVYLVSDVAELDEAEAA